MDHPTTSPRSTQAKLERSSIRLELDVPLDRVWLQRQAISRGMCVDEVVAALAGELEGRCVDAVQWHDAIAPGRMGIRYLAFVPLQGRE